MERKIFFIITILLFSTIAFSACTQTNEIKNSPDSGYEQEEVKQIWINDYQTAASLFSQLNEKYEMTQSNNSLELDSEWFVDFYKAARDLNLKYNYEMNTSDPQYKVRSTLGLIFRDLITLGHEYEKDLNGKESDIHYFKNSIEDNLEVLQSQIE